MGDLSRARICVVGAGVLGLACAAALVRRGAAVEVMEDRLRAPNASAVAAGMIAPALEAALEYADRARADLYREAAARWPAFARAHGVEHLRDGTDWRGPVEPLAARLDALEFAAEPRADGLFLPGESRVTPGQALAALAAGLSVLDRTATGVDRAGGRAVLAVEGADRTLSYDAIVLAQGWRGPALAGLGSMLEVIQPVKGQIAVLGPTNAIERTMRGPGVYLVPGEGGVLVGATMEPDASNTEVDSSVISDLKVRAEALVPGLAGVPVTAARAGVRGATPDGLPMAGGTPIEGVFTALAPRRNGWLLAPLVAETVAAAIAQEPPPPFAEALRPDRFGRTA